MISVDFEESLYKYIISIIQNRGHKVLSIGGMPDHVHILFGFRPTQSLSSLMQEVKRDSSEWINKNKLTVERFSWQEGYGAFSYSKSHVPNVINYILRQKAHHSHKTFLDEYRKMLDDFGVEYDPQYVFTSVE